MRPQRTDPAVPESLVQLLHCPDGEDRGPPRPGRELFVRVLPTEDTGRGSTAGNDVARAATAHAVVRLGHLRRRRLNPRTHARPRCAHEPRVWPHRNGAPDVRRAPSPGAGRHPRPATATPGCKTSWRCGATRPRTSTCHSRNSTTRPISVALAREIDDFSVGVAVHPEGHPASTVRGEDRRRQAEKLALADFGVSQFFFEPQVWFDFLADLEREGVTTPVIPGIMPVTNVKSVKRMAELSGADFPEWLERRLRAVEDDDAAMHRVGVEAAVELCRELNGWRRRRASTSTRSTAAPRPARSTRNSASAAKNATTVSFQRRSPDRMVRASCGGGSGI